MNSKLQIFKFKLISGILKVYVFLIKSMDFQLSESMAQNNERVLVEFDNLDKESFERNSS